MKQTPSTCHRHAGHTALFLVSLFVAEFACTAHPQRGTSPRDVTAGAEVALLPERLSPSLPATLTYGDSAELSAALPGDVAVNHFVSQAAPSQAALDAHGHAHDAHAAPEKLPWRFAVLSDLHLPNSGRVPARLRAMVAELVVKRPRFVVVTGDFTNGGENDSKWRRRKLPIWWAGVRAALNPLIEAGIPVLPIAGNHDAYLPAQRRAYAEAWSDLAQIAAPLTINSLPSSPAGASDPRVDAAPFSYSVDIDGVHLSFAHIVDAHLQKSVKKWLVADLESARDADHRIVFGHVPAKSIMARGSRFFTRTMGQLLADHDVFAYVAGHEHLLWDETFALADGRQFRQIIVGTGSASYQYAPTATARQRAECAGNKRDMLCAMPEGGYSFAMGARAGRILQDHSHAVMMFEIDASEIAARPLALDDAALIAFAEDADDTNRALAFNDGHDDGHGHQH